MLITGVVNLASGFVNSYVLPAKSHLQNDLLLSSGTLNPTHSLTHPDPYLLVHGECYVTSHRNSLCTPQNSSMKIKYTDKLVATGVFLVIFCFTRLIYTAKCTHVYVCKTCTRLLPRLLPKLIATGFSSYY